MTNITKEQLEAFMSKTHFDFSTKDGWEEFLKERSEGGTGRSADGIQLRDIKNYAVGTATVTSTGNPIKAKFKVMTLGTGLALPPGILHIYYPDANWTFNVKSIPVGSKASSMEIAFDIAGSGTSTRPDWGALYYIVQKVGELPGKGIAKMAGKKYLKEALSASSWLVRRGFNVLARGEAGYTVYVRVGSMPETNDYFLPQEYLSPSDKKMAKEVIDGVKDYVNDQFPTSSVISDPTQGSSASPLAQESFSQRASNFQNTVDKGLKDRFFPNMPFKN